MHNMLHYQHDLTYFIKHNAWPENSNISDTDKKRARIYRSNFMVSLAHNLNTTYKYMRQLVGDDNMRYIAHHYAMAYPPSTPILDDYGQYMGVFLESQPHIIADIPYLPAIARLEYMAEHVMKGIRPQGFSLQVLQETPIDIYSAWRVTLDDSCVILLNMPCGVEGLYGDKNIDIAHLNNDILCSILLLRGDDHVHVLPLKPWQHDCLQYLPHNLEEWTHYALMHTRKDDFQQFFVDLVSHNALSLYVD